nr:MAG TPA: hypothetical protein [Caudoviricetes sp.]
MVGDPIISAPYGLRHTVFNKGVNYMKTFTFEGKTHMFAEEVEPKKDGLYTATLTDHNNVRCEMWFINGELKRLVELD